MAIEEIELEAEETEEHMSDALSGVIGGRVVKFLLDYVDLHQLGWVFNADTDFKLPGIGNRRPDVAFCSFETLPELPRTVAPVLPDLAVEITSSRDEVDDGDKKLKEYRQVKIRLVWVIRPIQEVVEVYKNGQPTALLSTEGVLDGGDVLPGFTLSVKQLFDLPKKPETR